jgi:predicted acyltransferase
MIMARRVLSLDAIRGLAVALMIVVDSIGVLGVAPTQLRHAEWHGLTVADVVFPSSWSRSGRLAVLAKAESTVRVLLTTQRLVDHGLRSLERLAQRRRCRDF